MTDRTMQDELKARIEVFPGKMLVGKSLRMSLVENKTKELWQSFMIERATSEKTRNTELYSVQVYDNLDYFKNFKPQCEFQKFAGIEVIDFNNIPNGFEGMSIVIGLYAVFLHKGAASEFSKTAQFIFSEWLPNSKYVLDDRPHFELLGENYKNNHPDSEEEVWIPIKEKTEPNFKPE